MARAKRKNEPPPALVKPDCLGCAGDGVVVVESKPMSFTAEGTLKP